jgi:TPR repeat protein
MGDTFEPGQLIRLKAIGIRPDPDEARRWYEMARDLGDGEAARKRLERLGAR